MTRFGLRALIVLIQAIERNFGLDNGPVFLTVKGKQFTFSNCSHYRVWKACLSFGFFETLYVIQFELFVIINNFDCFHNKQFTFSNSSYLLSKAIEQLWV